MLLFRSNGLDSVLVKLLFYLFVLLLIGGLVSDYISIFLQFHGSSFWRISLVWRGGLALLITSVCMLFIFDWPNYTRWLAAVCLVSVIFLCLNYASMQLADMENYVSSTIELYKMIYPVLLFVALRLLAHSCPQKAKRLFPLLDVVLMVYLFFIFLGLMTGSEMFRTYWGGLRPGFKGIIMTQNEATGTVLLAIFWFGLRFFSGHRHVLFFAASILAAFVLGTKGAMLACIPLVAGLFWARYGMFKMVPVFGLVAGAVVVLAVLAYQYSETIHAGVTLFLNYMATHSKTDSVQSIIALLTSGRSDKLISFLPTLANDFSVRFLISGMPSAYMFIEIDPIDAFLRGGFLFLALLMVAYWKMFRFSGGIGGAKYKFVLFVIWMGIAFTGGHLWMAATTAPMLIIALAYAGQMTVYRRKTYPIGVKKLEMPPVLYKVIVTGTDPESGMGGIGFALPGFFFAMRRAGIEYEFIPTHHAAEWGGKWLWLLRAIPIIYRSIKVGKSAGKDIIVYSHAGAVTSMLRGGCVLAFARLLGAKTVMQLHSITVNSDLDSFWKRILFLIATAPATAISVLTPWWNKRLVDIGIQKRIFVIPNVLPEELEKKAAARISHSFGQDKLFVLALSHVEPGKGIDLLIEAMPALPDHVYLTVAGDGSQLGAMKNRVDVLGLNPRVTFTGWVSGEKKQLLLDEASIYCLPTSYDSFGMGFLEAMANGLPVVALDWGPIGDVVKHEYCGLLIDDKSHKLLSGAIERLLDNDLRQHMGEHAQQWVLDEFGSKRVGGLLCDMFEKVTMRIVE